MEAYPTLEYQNIKGDNTYVEDPGCGGPWVTFSSGAVKPPPPTLEYQKEGGKTYVKAPGCGGPWAIIQLAQS